MFKSEKSEHFYITHEHFKKITLALFWQKNKHCFKHFMLFFTSSIAKSLVRIAAEVNLENERFTVVCSRCR